jgi:Protein of unknown function (DUF3386)
MTEQRTAQELFQAAYENRYTWDKSFPGYSADVQLTQNGEIFNGQAQVNADYSTAITGIDDKEASDTVKGQLWEIAVHRVRRTFEETHGKNTFEYGDTDATGAVEILIGGKASGDKYKLRNNEVCMVHRKIHGTIVTIHTSSSHDTGAGYLSHQYDSVYSDPATGEAKGGRTLFTDLYTQVGDYFILNERTMADAETGDAVKIQFTNIQMLAVKEAATAAA